VTPTDTAAGGPAALERVWLDERSWVDVARGWLPGADDVYDALVEQAAWYQGRIWRYERWVEEPRLSAPARNLAELHPALLEAHRRIHREYGVAFAPPALAWYRDGNDSVAFHRDRELRWLDDTVIAVLTLGARRSWWLRPRAARYDHEAPNRGATHDVAPASGDLLVMGGRCQADWEHSVPKVRTSSEAARGRVSVQWRWTSLRGRPETGANFRAPRFFNR
jgi:alkylated DNA repair dioxygenase AlkB